MNSCTQLKAYLNDELNMYDADEFTIHLQQCAACNSQVCAEREFERLVRAAKHEFDAATQLQQHKVWERARATARPKHILRSPLAAAAAVAFIALIGGGIMLTNSDPDRAISSHAPDNVPGESPSKESSREPTVAADQEKQELVQVSLDQDSPYLAVPVETSDPAITIYWLHPTFENDDPGESPSSSSPIVNPQSLLASFES